MRGSPPFGWKVQNGELVEDQDQQGTIVRARELYHKGLVYRDIAAILEAEGRKPKRGDRWHPQTVGRLVTELTPEQIARQKIQGKHYRLRKYGISAKEYNYLLIIQEYSCAICRKKFTPEERIQVDHSHHLQIVRGLLCASCNVSIPNKWDDPVWRARALAYLGYAEEID